MKTAALSQLAPTHAVTGVTFATLTLVLRTVQSQLSASFPAPPPQTRKEQLGKILHIQIHPQSRLTTSIGVFGKSGSLNFCPMDCKRRSTKYPDASVSVDPTALPHVTHNVIIWSLKCSWIPKALPPLGLNPPTKSSTLAMWCKYHKLYNFLSQIYSSYSPRHQITKVTAH